MNIVFVGFLLTFNYDRIDPTVGIFVRFTVEIDCWTSLKLRHRSIVSSRMLPILTRRWDDVERIWYNATKVKKSCLYHFSSFLWGIDQFNEDSVLIQENDIPKVLVTLLSSVWW